MLLSKAEGLGLVFWEAMYMRVPVIGSPVGGILETIGGNGSRGFLWEESLGIEDLHDKLNKCIAHTEEVEIMKDRAYAYVATIITNNVSINTIVRNEK
jgi:glycosyltransferase involved in cell wall biosynthesis